VTLTRFFRECSRFLGQIGAAAIRDNESAIAARLRQRALHTEALIDTGVRISNPGRLTLGKGSALYHGCYVLNPSGNFTMGARSHMGAFCYVNVCFGNVTVGDDVAIGPGSCIFAYSNHYEKGKKVSEVRLTRDVKIGNNVFIGGNCTVLPGAVIHDNVVVAAGTVVRGELDSNAIYGGVPCRRITDGWYE
jgi:acetyltransferase-like isoleucine patch superfamily enzyme